MMNSIGIVGGVGPFAGVDLHAKIIRHTKAMRDQDHIPIYHISCAHSIGDRTEYFFNTSLRNPALDMFEIIVRLYKLGCRHIGIPCNTAHVSPIREVLDELLQKNIGTDINLVHMIEEIGHYLVKNNIYKVGLLATKGTCKSQLYHEVLQKYNIELCMPSTEGLIEGVHDSIYDSAYGIKAKTPVSQKAKDILLEASKDLQKFKVQGIIMGCTEIPLALSQDMIDIPLIDATDILAKALVQYSNPEKLI